MRPSTLAAAARPVLVTVALALALAAAPALVHAAPAGAQEPTTTSEPAESPAIIPEPNSGSEPEDAGDRGGLLQTGLFVLILVAVGLIAVFVVRESRKARERRGF